ncbi:MAG: hypothetical protein ACJAVN_001914 [Roseivirga sp.]
MKKTFSLILLTVLICSCEFGEKKPAVKLEESPEAIPKFVNYKVESINEQSGPCQTDSLSNQCASFFVEYPIITGMLSPAATKRINENIKSSIFDYAFVSDKPENFQSLIEEISSEYTKILSEFPDYKASWSMEVNSDIIYQDSSYISVASTIFSYTGGAHPNAYQVYRSYDLQTGEPITLSDILIPGFEDQLNEMAEIEFRMLKEIPPSQALKVKGYFFEGDKFTLNDNFAIINKSLIFYFNQFEIAPYAVGPTELELKLTDYVNLVDAKGILNGLKN